MEEFDPYNPEYKKVADLPIKEQADYVDVPEGGFVKRNAAEEFEKAKEIAEYHNENRSISKKIFGIDKINEIDILRSKAGLDNYHHDVDNQYKERQEKYGPIQKQMLDKYEYATQETAKILFYMEQLEKSFGSLEAVRGKRILDLGCGNNDWRHKTGNPDGGEYEFEPWFSRLLLELGANPVGVDIGDLSNEEFENYKIDLSIKGALDFLPDKSFDGVYVSLFLTSPRLKKIIESREERRSDVFEEIKKQIQRLLKDDGKIIHFDEDADGVKIRFDKDSIQPL